MHFDPVDPYTTIEEEFEDRTRKIFTEDGLEEVWVTSRRDAFHMAMYGYCIHHGWMDGEIVPVGTQESHARYWLTPEGAKHFGIC